MKGTNMTDDLDLPDLADEVLRTLQGRGCTPESAAMVLTIALASLAMGGNQELAVRNLRKIMAKMEEDGPARPH
jgi:hypothetical protein